MNANINPSHSFTEGADYEPGYIQLQPITAGFLLKNNFQQVDDTVYELRMKNENMSALILTVDIISPAIGYMVSIRNERDPDDAKHSILPIETQPQLAKLLQALQGK